MIAVLGITTPIFLLILLGYAATRFRVIGPDDVRSLGTFVVRFALPALIVHALSTRPLREVIDVRFLLVYAAASLVVFGFVYAVARFGLKRGPAASAVHALGAASPNSGFVGFPVASLVVGPPTAATALALAMTVENVVTIPLALAVAESEAHAGTPIARVAALVAGRLAKNPMILAIVVGMIVSASGVGLPAVLAKPIGMLAAASGATALFVIGGALAGGGVGDVAKEALLPVSAKLLLHPLVTLGGLAVLPLASADLRLSLLVITASPMLTIYALLGRPYGRERICAAALVMATVASFFSLSALLWFTGATAVTH